jgi:hypothetical protein
MVKLNHRIPANTEVLQGPFGEVTYWELITPERAAMILRDYNSLNRPLKPSLYMNYAKDMADGRFMRTHQGIGFDVDGILTDGQNRLQGIVTSGEPQWMMVTYGLDPDTRSVTDAGGVRNLPARMSLVGFKWLTAGTMAIVRRMIAGFTLSLGTQMRASEAQLALTRHAEALLFVEEGLRSNVRGVTLSSVKAVLVRAYYHAPRAPLEAFMRILTTGLPASDLDQAAVVLRNGLLMTPSTSRGTAQQVKVYRYTERHLRAYLDGEALGRMSMATRELFPLPEEQEAKKPRALKRRRDESTGAERALA